MRFTEGFFERLEVLLPEERGANGTPSVTDFIAFEVPAIRDRLAVDALGVTLPIGSPAVRVSVTSGVLLSRIAVYVRVDGEDVEVFDLDLDLDLELS